MADARPDRPVFSQGQYIGAADLNGIVDYARDGQRRLQLSGLTWGIAVGLDLIELPAAGGGVEMWIEPGVAWDGYGRLVLVPAPALVSPDLFASFTPNTVYPVWLRYDEPQNQSSSASNPCSTGTSTTMIQESYAIEAGRIPLFTNRQSGITIGGSAVADPRDMLRAVNQNAAVVLDGAAPQQAFPADSDNPLWLIPVGMAVWNGINFVSRSTDQLKQSRAYRRYIAAVAESVLAADGVLRLRDRQTDKPAGLTEDQLDQNSAIQETDLYIDQNTGRCRGLELVWIEGSLRVTGDARLFGTKLDFRDGTGKETDNRPLYIQRGHSKNSAGGQDLQVTVGAAGDGSDRLTIGYLNEKVSPSAFAENVTVGSDGQVCIAGKVGIGSTTTPRTAFDLRANISGDPTNYENHVAIIENLSGSNSSALALKIDTSTSPDASSNLITFFNGANPIGSIKPLGFTLPASASYNFVQPDPTPNDSAVLTSTGITVVTNGADFAECLPRVPAAAPIGPGRIVGVFGGRVSLATQDADSLLVTTDRPAVLGNAIGGDRSAAVEAVALVGQVAVIVEGAVKSGDFIVPSGRGDGIGRAVAPQNIGAGELHQIVGRAWQSSDSASLKRINAIVDTTNNAMRGIATMLSEQTETIRTLTEEIARLKRKLDE